MPPRHEFYNENVFFKKFARKTANCSCQQLYQWLLFFRRLLFAALPCPSSSFALLGRALLSARPRCCLLRSSLRGPALQQHAGNVKVLFLHNQCRRSAAVATGNGRKRLNRAPVERDATKGCSQRTCTENKRKVSANVFAQSTAAQEKITKKTCKP